MKTLLRDTRVQRLLVANITGSIGSGVTIIAVPWLLIHRAGGDRLYGWTTLGTTLALFLMMPHYGAWLDRHSRKTMLLVGELFGFVATLAMASLSLATGRVETWQLVTIYFCGMLYYTLHYPAKYAFLQQIFARDQYQSLMGLLEIQGQTAMMVAGGLGSLLIDRVPLPFILLFDAFTYLFSFLVQSTLPYESTHLTDPSRAGFSPPSAKIGIRHSIVEGWQWLRARPAMSLFFACTLMPFIAVMVGNYLFPIYVSEVLHASADVFGRGELVFAIGAILAGASVPRLATERGAERAILWANGLCLIAVSLFTFASNQGTYYFALLLFGYGNAGTRVGRHTLLFVTVPNAVMGRVGMFFNVYDRVLRTALTFAMTLLVPRTTATAGYAVLLACLVLAFAGALRSRRSLSFNTAVPV